MIKYTKYIIYSMSIGCLCILVFLMLDLSNTIDQLAISLIDQKKEQTKKELDLFFNPVVEDIETTINHGKSNFFDSLSIKEFNLHFIPFIQSSKPISSMMLANLRGDEKMLLEMDSTWINRHTFIGSVEKKADRYEWEYKNGQLDTIRNWKEEKDYDPRERPWFKEAIEQNGKLNWTAPYIFFTTKDPGITASIKWINNHNEPEVFGFDLMLMDISDFTSNLKISKNGKVFILTEDEKILGLPYDERFKNKDSLKFNVLKTISEINIPVLSKSKKIWESLNKNSKCFSFDHNDEKWWGSFSEYKLGNNLFLIGVIAPESDFLSSIQETRMLILGGFILILFFTLIITANYRQIRKGNLKLKEKNIEVEFQKSQAEEQKQIVEEKNKEITDSIQYAKRIQNAILPRIKVVKECIKESFILYKPKDIVAGDFYWLEQKNGYVLFAVADCTGHGVPGAMVSVVCNNALNRAVREYGITDPGKILDKAREIVVQEFEKSDEDVKDGMDIALCSLKENQLQYAGAHNPLWLIRNGNLIETKADKQPIGKFSNAISFTTHNIQLQKGDNIYIFSDGYADQFGGDKGKKFKTKALKELIIKIHDKPMEEQRFDLENVFENWKKDLHQLDDVCIIGVKYN